MLAKIKADDIGSLIEAPLNAADLRNMIDNHRSYFDELHKDATENELYLEGVNLTQAQRAIYANKGRGHFPIPIVSDKLSRIISSERNSRTTAKAEATKPESEVTAELFTLRFRKIEKDSNLEYIESEIFASGVGAKYGVAEIKIDYDASNSPIIKITKRDYLDVVWDSNAKEYDKSDGSFMGYQKKVYRMDIRKDYGDKVADSIQVNDTGWGRDIKETWGVQDKNGKRDQDIIVMYCVWVKTMRKTYHVVFSGDDFVEYSRADAENRELNLKMPYILLDQEIPPSEIVEHDDWGYDYYETTFNEILYYEQTELNNYPLEVYQSFHFEDKIWCLTDILKPGNKLMDKMLAQIDYALGTDVKNGWELVTSWLEQGITVEDAIRRIKNGDVVPVIRPGALSAIKQRGFNPQWMEVLSVIKSMEDQFVGGDLYSGVKEGRQRESENAIAMKLKQQELIATLFIDNLRRWKRGLFKKVAWFIKKYDTAQSLQKILGSSISPEMKNLLIENKVYIPSKTNDTQGYIKMNSNELTMLKDADVEIYITEESLNDTQKLAMFQRMTIIEKSDPDLLLSETWRKKKLELIDEVSYEDRQKVITEIQEAKAQQAQQAQLEQQKQDAYAQQEINIRKAQVLVSDKGSQIPSIKKQKNDTTE